MVEGPERELTTLFLKSGLEGRVERGRAPALVAVGEVELKLLALENVALPVTDAHRGVRGGLCAALGIGG